MFLLDIGPGWLNSNHKLVSHVLSVTTVITWIRQPIAEDINDRTIQIQKFLDQVEKYNPFFISLLKHFSPFLQLPCVWMGDLKITWKFKYTAFWLPWFKFLLFVNILFGWGNSISCILISLFGQSNSISMKFKFPFLNIYLKIKISILNENKYESFFK